LIDFSLIYENFAFIQAPETYDANEDEAILTIESKPSFMA